MLAGGAPSSRYRVSSRFFCASWMRWVISFALCTIMLTWPSAITGVLTTAQYRSVKNPLLLGSSTSYFVSGMTSRSPEESTRFREARSSLDVVVADVHDRQVSAEQRYRTWDPLESRPIVHLRFHYAPRCPCIGSAIEHRWPSVCPAEGQPKPRAGLIDYESNARRKVALGT